MFGPNVFLGQLELDYSTIASDAATVTVTHSGGSRQYFDRVLSERNLEENEIFVHFDSKLESLTGFQKPRDPSESATDSSFNIITKAHRYSI